MDAPPGPLGVLILDTRFPRVPGDAGYPGTFGVRVLYQRLPRATAVRVVREGDAGLLDACRNAARDLVSRGAVAVTTTCGFLAPFQDRLASAVDVPVLTSSLLLVPLIARMVGPGRAVGVLTIERRSLRPAHQAGAGAHPDVPVVVGGLDEVADGRFHRQILEDETELDVATARAEHREAARRLVAAHPEVAAIVLECANMPPYRADVQGASGRPVWDLTDLVRLVLAGVLPPRPVLAPPGPR